MKCVGEVAPSQQVYSGNTELIEPEQDSLVYVFSMLVTMIMDLLLFVDSFMTVVLVEVRERMAKY